MLTLVPNSMQKLACIIIKIIKILQLICVNLTTLIKQLHVPIIDMFISMILISRYTTRNSSCLFSWFLNFCKKKKMKTTSLSRYTDKYILFSYPHINNKSQLNCPLKINKYVPSYNSYISLSLRFFIHFLHLFSIFKRFLSMSPTGYCGCYLVKRPVLCFRYFEEDE